MGPGEDGEAHFAQLRNQMGYQDRFKYPQDFGGDHAGAAAVALRGQLDTRAGSGARLYLLTSVDDLMAADAMSKNGLGDNDDDRLQVQAFGIPDDAAKVWAQFEDCDVPMLENYFKRKASEGVTVESLITSLQAEDFEPSMEVGTWWDSRAREYRKVRAHVSLREFYKEVAKLLPGEDDYTQRRSPISGTPQWI